MLFARQKSRSRWRPAQRIAGVLLLTLSCAEHQEVLGNKAGTRVPRDAQALGAGVDPAELGGQRALGADAAVDPRDDADVKHPAMTTRGVNRDAGRTLTSPTHPRAPDAGLQPRALTEPAEAGPLSVLPGLDQEHEVKPSLTAGGDAAVPMTLEPTTASSTELPQQPGALEVAADWDEWLAQLADDCVLTSYTVSATSCAMFASCAAGEINTGCGFLDGEASCSGLSLGEWTYYHVSGTDLLGACSLILSRTLDLSHGLGAQDNAAADGAYRLPWQHDPSSCFLDVSSNETHCGLLTSCPHSVELATGEVNIAEESQPNAECSDYLAEGPACGCSAADRSESLQFVGVGFDEACGLAAGVCTGELALDFGSEIGCVESGRYYQSDGCNIDAVCGPSAVVRDGVSARKLRNYTIGCGVSSDAFWHCSCLGRPDATLGLTLTNSVADPCTELVDLCYPPTKSIERLDAWRCDPSASGLDADNCQATLPCDGHATIDGIAVDLRVAADLRCTPASVGSLACECGGDGTGAPTAFEMPLEADADATCQAALTHCQNLAETDQITVRAL